MRISHLIRLMLMCLAGSSALSPVVFAESAAAPSHAILMTFWSNDMTHHGGNPMPGSLDVSAMPVTNPVMQKQLDAIDVLAYAFLRVDAAGDVYFANAAVDLSSADLREYCQQHPAACPHADSAMAGSFSAFARLKNRAHTLRRVASLGGAGSQSSLDNALNHQDELVRSATDPIRQFDLDGIDLDFEPDEFFAAGQGEQYAKLIDALRRALGPTAFISIEVPSDWETLRSLDCPAGQREMTLISMLTPMNRCCRATTTVATASPWLT